MTIVLGLRYSRLPGIRALLAQPELYLERLGTTGTARVQLDGMTEERVTGGKDPEMEIKILLSIPGVWLRGPETEYSTPADHGPTGRLDVFPGLTGKITDALVRFTGVTNPKIADSAGSFMAYAGEVPPGSYLILDSATGRGYMRTSEGWDITGKRAEGGESVTEVDPLRISYGKGPAFFTVTPFIDRDPESPAGRLTVTSNAGGAPLTVIRGRNAYSV